MVSKIMAVVSVLSQHIMSLVKVYGVPWRSSISDEDSHFLMGSSSTFGLHMVSSSDQWLLVAVSMQQWPHPGQQHWLAGKTWCG